MTNKNIQFENIVNLMNEGIIIDDENENILFANDTFCKIVGYSKSKIVGMSSVDFWDEESAKKIREVDATVRKKGKSSTYECNLMSKDGNLIPVLVSGAPRKEGGSVGIITDLTKIKEQERKLARFSKAVENSHDAHIMVGESGRVHMWNQGAKDIFGLSETQAKKHTIGHITDDKIQVQKNHQYETKEAKLNINGRDIWIAYTLERTETKPPRYLCIIRDITQNKKLQKQLQERYHKMHEAIKEFGIIRRKMDYFHDLYKKTQETTNLKEFGQFVTSSIHMISGAHSCMLRLKKGKNLEILATHGLGKEWYGRKKIPLKSKIVQSTFGRGSSKVFDAQSDQDIFSKKLLKKNNITSMMIFGLTFREEQIGTLSIHLASDEDWSVFEDEYLINYVTAIEICLGSLLSDKGMEVEKYYY